MKINIVTDIWKDDRKGGDVEYVRTPSGEISRMHIVCPKCGHLAAINFNPPNASGWTWDGNEAAPTARPSILHDSPRCGWHVYLTAGEFVAC